MLGGNMNWTQIVTNILGMITPQMEAGLCAIAITIALVYGLFHGHYAWFWTSVIASGGLVSIVWMLQTAYGVNI